MESHDMHVIADSNLDTFAEVIRFSRMEFNSICMPVIMGGEI